MAILSTIRHRFWNNDGTVASGGKVYVYEPGTTTLKNSWTDSTQASENTNPVILDAKGEADIWTSGLCKINVLQSDDVQVTGYPVDYVGGGQTSYDIAGFLSGKPANSEIVLRLPMVMAVTFDVNFSGSRGTASVAATASTTYTISRIAGAITTQIGTMVFALGATTASFVAAAAVTLADGDILMVTAPASADATLANVGFNLAGSVTP